MIPIYYAIKKIFFKKFENFISKFDSIYMLAVWCDVDNSATVGESAVLW